MQDESPLTDRAVARAFWLAELAKALRDADRLANVLGESGIDGSEMEELRRRIVEMSAAVSRLQRDEAEPGDELPLGDVLG